MLENTKNTNTEVQKTNKNTQIQQILNTINKIQENTRQ